LSVRARSSSFSVKGKERNIKDIGLKLNVNTLLADYCDSPPKESFPEVKDAARKALSFDDALAEAWNSLAYMTYHYDFDFKGAEGYFKRALELNPNYATGHFWYSELLCYLQRFDDAFDEAKKAMELDPISMIIHNNLGMVYFYARKPDWKDELLNLLKNPA
jgi:tetratricopeptide (TPR) repeat protein